MTRAPYQLSADKARLDLDVIHQFLSVEGYWSPGIAREKVARAIEHSEIVGAYDHAGAQVGYARAVTDYATFAWIADVFVLDGHRGHGLARAMVADLLARLDPLGLRQMLLATADAHGVYEALGFKLHDQPERVMRRRPPHGPIF